MSSLKSQLKRKLEQVIKRKVEQFKAGLVDSGFRLYDLSQNLVPIDTGRLKESGQVAVEEKGGKLYVSVMYEESYAIFVHENLSAHHDEGQAKFLEQPLRANYQELLRQVIERVQK